MEEEILKEFLKAQTKQDVKRLVAKYGKEYTYLTLYLLHKITRKKKFKELLKYVELPPHQYRGKGAALLSKCKQLILNELFKR